MNEEEKKEQDDRDAKALVQLFSEILFSAIAPPKGEKTPTLVVDNTPQPYLPRDRWGWLYPKWLRRKRKDAA